MWTHHKDQVTARIRLLPGIQAEKSQRKTVTEHLISQIERLRDAPLSRQSVHSRRHTILERLPIRMGLI